MSDSRSRSKVFVGRIASQTSKKTLEKEFSKYGRVKDIEVKNHYAFIVSFIIQTFSDSRDAQDAIHYMDGKFLDGSRLKVERAEGKRYDREPERRRDRNDRYDNERDRDKDRDKERDKDRNERSSREERGERRGPSSSDKCFNCNKLGHWANQCRESKSIRCFRCNEKGHMKRDCRMSRTPSPNRRTHGDNKRSSRSRSRSRSNSAHSSQKRSPSPKSDRKSPSPQRSPSNSKENNNSNKNSASRSPSHEKEKERNLSPIEKRESPHPNHEEYDNQSSQTFLQLIIL